MGRFCDGYGIWGGGGNINNDRHRLAELRDGRMIPRSPASVLIIGKNAEEKGHFEWFKHRTATKIPGSFNSSFWTTLLFQASLSEQAVFHAVIALSSVHKAGIVSHDGCKTDNPCNQPERFTLQNYSKAISYLQPHFSLKDKTAYHVTLITCVVFVSLEFLRGHFKMAQIHLQNGLNILGEMHILSKVTDGVFRLNPQRDSTDDWIVEAFSRLQLQVELFRHAYQHPCRILDVASPRYSAPEFHSVIDFWPPLERLMNKVLYLAYQARQQEAFKCESLRDPIELLEHQQDIKMKLGQWLDQYKALVGQKKLHNPEEKLAQLLHVYHTLSNIMVDTCLQPNDEMIFDIHRDQFILLITQLVNLRVIRTAGPPSQVLRGHVLNMSRSVIDLGWISPLYYVAVKCRIHRIRLHAIRLLESISHREGIWDARTAACIARKVLEVEERDFYEDLDLTDDFPLSATPRPQELLLPTLPESYRLSEVEVVLSGAPMDKALLFCKQKQGGVDYRVLISEYDVHLQRWTDGGCR